MKRVLDDLLPCLILAFATSFMLFIYEPIIMYSNNINDFWFDLSILYKNSVHLFLLLFFVIFFSYFLFYFIDKKIFKNKKIYNILLIIGYIIFISIYIEGNYMAGFLPPLDGTSIVWKNFIKESIISIIILIIVSTLIFALYKKYNFKMIGYLKYIGLAIFIMISSSLLTTLLTTNALKQKEYTVTSTPKNINTYSENENFIIFLLDAVDSRTFYKVLNTNDEYKDIFNDFTYYPDTMGAYPFTRDSIPFILSGVWNNNKDEFKDYYVKSMDKSPLLKNLYDEKYDVNIYDTDILYNSKNAEKIKNLSFSSDYDEMNFKRQELKYVLFKYLPFYLKKYSKIDTLNFNGSKLSTDGIFDLLDTTFNSEYMSDFKNSKSNQFKFIHLEGAHVPFNLDKDLNRISGGTYDQKVESNIVLTGKYMSYLKKNNVYDNSNIIVMSDHGYDSTTDLRRQNPILFIKGKNEKHNLKISDKAISYDDLQSAYSDLLDHEKSINLFSDISSKRSRRYLFYYYGKEDNMIEYIQKEKAWDTNAMEKTGKEFNR